MTVALVNAILPTVARRGGLAPIGLSALAAAPFVANLLGAFAGRYGARNTAQLGLIRGIGAASLLLLFLVPPAPIVIVVAVVFWLSLSFGSPFQLRLWGAMYPARLRGGWSVSSGWAARPRLPLRRSAVDSSRMRSAAIRPSRSPG